VQLPGRVENGSRERNTIVYGSDPDDGRDPFAQLGKSLLGSALVGVTMDDDTIKMYDVTITAVTEKLEKIIEEIQHNDHLMHVHYVDMVNASNLIGSRNADITWLLNKNIELRDQISGLQAVLDKVTRDAAKQ